MSAETKIQWCDASLSPWEGCTKVSEGCAHCYAEARDKRRLHEPVSHWGPGAKRWRVKTFEANALALERRAVREGRRLRVFPSLCDPFDPEVPAGWLASFLGTVRTTTHLDWLLLTKRPELWSERIGAAMVLLGSLVPPMTVRTPTDLWLAAWLEAAYGRGDLASVPRNVWLGTSAENQARLDERGPDLAAVPARVRFVSMEPLLGPVDLEPHIAYRSERTRIDWVIFGGESGQHARYCDPAWIREGVRQCRLAAVPAFVKQLGSNAGMGLHWQDKGGDPGQWPEDLRVREMVEVKV